MQLFGVALDGPPVLLDGGMGRELMRRGLDLPDELWSGHALLVRPDLVLRVHQDFLHAGAQIVTTNTYGITARSLQQASPKYVALYRELITLAVGLAREAVDGSKQQAVIAGSMPPLGRSYRPDAVLPAGEMANLYEQHAALLADAGVGGLLAETLTSLDEGEAAIRAARSVNLDIAISFTLNEQGRLRSDVAFDEAAARMADAGASAVLANCSTPAAISLALDQSLRHAGVPIGAYANAFQPIAARYSYREHGPMQLDTELTPMRYANWATQWLAHGVQIIGGCCGIGPSHIAVLNSLLPTWRAAY